MAAFLGSGDGSNVHDRMAPGLHNLFHSDSIERNFEQRSPSLRSDLSHAAMRAIAGRHERPSILLCLAREKGA